MSEKTLEAAHPDSDETFPMTATSIRFTLRDLALIEMEHFDSLSETGQESLKALVFQDPRFADQFSELQAMRRDVKGELLLEGLDVYEIWDALMREDSWEHALKLVSEEDGVEEVWWYRYALHLATTLAQRAEDPSRILTIRRRLQMAQAAHRLGTGAFSAFAQYLETLEPEAAEGALDWLKKCVYEREEWTGS